MSIDPSLSRRAAIVAGTAASGTACALALAGCAPSANDLRSKAKTPAEIPSAGTPYQVGKLSELPVGGTAAGTANGIEVMLFRSDETTVLAYTDICTHAGCKVSPDGENFKCPCHGTVFNGSDGTVQSGPAKEPLPRYAAAIDGEWITVSV